MFATTRTAASTALLIALAAPLAAGADERLILPESLAPSLLLENSGGEYDHWKGIGRLESLGNRRCTAVLIDTRSPAAAADAPAYVLTSGHCAYEHGQADLNHRPLPMRGHVEFNFFRDTAADRQVHPLKRLHWSTLRGRDLAIIELATPLHALIKAGIEPLALAAQPPRDGDELLSVSAPLTATGYTLRVSSCPMNGLRDVVEHPYVWRDNLRNACTDVLPGSSGSPLLDRESGRIVGIMGTTTRGASADTRCAKDSPCEVQDGNILWQADTNYATRTERLGACFTAGMLDISLEHCDLQGAFPVVHRNPYYQPRMVAHASERSSWQLPLTIGSSHYYFKAVRNAMACENPNGYSAAHPSSPEGVIDPPIADDPGMHLLCVLGMNPPSEEVSSAALQNVYIAAREVTEQPVRAQAMPVVTLLENGKYSIQLTVEEPHQVRHLFKFGPPGTTDCDDSRGYRHHSYNFTNSPRLLPVTLCTQAFDAADRASPARADLLEAPGA